VRVQALSVHDMRLLHTHSLHLEEFQGDNTPPYVVASHRWFRNSEATYQDVRDRRNTNSDGYHKVEAFAQYIRNNIPHVKWLWIDTYCINKDSATHSGLRLLIIKHIASTSAEFEGIGLHTPASVWARSTATENQPSGSMHLMLQRSTPC
jgi:hypothetical protein